jgi:tetratricopeptide (TPR) repeat protein
MGMAMDEIAKLLLVEERARAVHAAIGSRRMLLVIDDVWEASEGLTFKIGGPNCAYLVTTRLPRIALDFAGEGARHVEELDQEDGLQLLSLFVNDVVDSHPAQARALVRQVGGLPLALVLMGRYLQKKAYGGRKPRLQRAMEQLQKIEERMRLAQVPTPLDQQPSLSASTPLSLHAVIAISDESLSDESQRALRAMSVFPPKPNTFSEEAALLVSRSSIETLDRLVDCGLLEIRSSNRFTLHQTISEYASLERKDEAPQGRFVDFYVRFVEDHKDDFASLEPELRNIFTALTAAHEVGMLVELVRGVNSLFLFIENKGLFDAAEIHLQRAMQAARDIGDDGGLITTLVHLGKVGHLCGDYESAEAYYEEARALARKLEDEDRLGAVLQGLGVVAFSCGKYEEAEKWLQEGLSLAEQRRNINLINALQTNLGVLLFNQGDYDEAERQFHESLGTARALGDRETTSRVLINLGVVAARRWKYKEAEACFQESLELARGVGRRDTMSFLLTNLGTLANDQGQLDKAESYFQEGLELAWEVNDRARVSHLFANLGALANARKDYAQAQTYLEEGLALARKIGHRENTCLLLTNLGVLSRDTNNYERSEALFQEALALAQEMGHRRYVAAILINWGDLHLLRGVVEGAAQAFQQALEVADEIEQQEMVASALFGQARVAALNGDHQTSRRLGQESTRRFGEIDHPRLVDVQAWLNEQ